MLSTKLKLALILTPLFVTGCVRPTIYAPATSCSSLLPSAWEAGVQSASVPPERPQDASTEDRLRDWGKFAVEQTGQLKKANGRYVSAVGIVQRCEERDKAAVKKSKSRFLGIF